MLRKTITVAQAILLLITGQSILLGQEITPGAKVWEFTTGDDVFSSPTIGADGTVYVGSDDYKIYALDGATGAKRWEFTTGDYVFSSPTIGADGTVYVGSDDNKVYALDGATGAKRWEFATGTRVSSSPAAGPDGTVYVGSGDGKVYALNGATGTKRWEFKTGSGVFSSPSIGADGTVYVGSHDNKVYALDGATGAKRWEFTTGDRVFSSPSIDADGTVYVGSYDNKVYALDGATGAKRWEFITGNVVYSSPAIGTDGTVYVGSWDHKVYALDGATGAERWTFTTGDVLRSSPAIGTDGTVYIGSRDKKVYALDGATGAKRWEFATGNDVRSSPAIGADGTVYIGSRDNNVYALKGSAPLAESSWPMFRQNVRHTGQALIPPPPPNAPNNLLPADQATNESLTPTLQASAFDHPNAGDTHAASQWVIRRATDNEIVFNSDEDPVNKTSLTLPSGVLTRSTTYLWGVRYQDGAGAWSSYSTPTSFTTQAGGGLVAHWRLDEGDGSIALDTAEAGHNGTIHSAFWMTGRIGGALNFDGIDAHVVIPNQLRLDFAGVVTLAAWIKPQSTDGVRNIVAHGYSTSPAGAVFLRINDGHYEVGSWDGDTFLARSEVPKEDLNNWVHLAGVYDGAAWRLYRNGLEVSSAKADTGAVPVDADWGIGATGAGTERFFQGVIDDARIYDSALSAAEIAELESTAPRLAIWEFTASGGMTSSPATGTDGTVYVGSRDHNVYALEGATGAKRWEFSTGDWVTSSPAIGTDGTVYIGSWDHNVYALDGATGDKRWAFSTDFWVTSSPAIGADGTVYVGSNDKKVYALDGTTGAKRWEFSTGDWTTSSPAIGADGTVYIGSNDKKVYALDGTTGAKRWEFPTGGWVTSSPGIGADGTVYIGSNDNNIYALDGLTGAKRWEFSTGDWVTSSPAIGADGTVYVGSNDKKVYALDGVTGAKRWEFSTGDWVTSSPAIGADSTVYVGSNDKKVYALDAATGAKSWEFSAGDQVRPSPVIGANGTVYIGSLDNKVYALKGIEALAESPWPMFRQNVQHTGQTGGVTPPVEPRITTQPQSQTALCRADAGFSVDAIGTPPLTYQWNHNGNDIPGAADRVLFLSSVSAADGGDYTVVVSNVAGSTVSAAASLTMPSPQLEGTIIQQTQTASTGANAEFTVAASGSEPLAFQWRFEEHNIAGATGTTLNLSNVSDAYAGFYDVVISNACDKVVIGPAILIVLNLDPPRIIVPPQSQIAFVGSAASFTVKAEGTQPLSYQWHLSGLPIPGATSDALSLDSVQHSDAGSYSVTVSSEAGSASSPSVSLSVEDPTALTGTVTDALTGEPLSGVALGFGDRQTTTDAEGRYRFSNLVEGVLRANFDGGPLSGPAPLTVRFSNQSTTTPLSLSADKPDYVTFTNPQVLLPAGTSTELNFSMSPVLLSGLRVVLDWARKPDDLDLHMSIVGTDIDVSFGNPVSSVGQLDHDRNRAAPIGAETITADRISTIDVYHFYVVNFDWWTGELTNSVAQAHIYRGAEELHAVSVPATGSGRNWHIATVNGSTGAIGIINQITESAALPTESTGGTGGTSGDGMPADLQYHWDFGDGTTSADENPMKVYRESGTYTVSLRVEEDSVQSEARVKDGFVLVAGAGLAISWVNERVVLTVSGVASQTYRIEVTPNLGPMAAWQTVATLRLTDGEQSQSWTDDESRNHGSRFYRAVSP